MKKKVIAIGIISMFLLTGLVGLSATGIKTTDSDREASETIAMTSQNTKPGDLFDGGLIAGKVVYRTGPLTYEPLEGAEVSISGYDLPNQYHKSFFYSNKTTTNGDGYFKFGNAYPNGPDLPRPGFYFVSVFAEGYEYKDIIPKFLGGKYTFLGLQHHLYSVDFHMTPITS